jgi:hypothetical protein
LTQGTAVERLLDVLLAQGTITREQHDELLAQARRDEALAAAQAAEAERGEATAPTAPVSSGGEAWDFRWSEGFKLQRSSPPSATPTTSAPRSATSAGPTGTRRPA